MPESLVVMTRFPVPGRVKTRLIPVLGPEGAADLHASMVRRTLTEARALAAHTGVQVTVAYDGGTRGAMRRAFGQARYIAQSGGDLGARIASAIESEFDRGAARVVVIGTDCPMLDAECMSAAFSALASAPVVLGPAADGGYYLVGVRSDLATEARASMMTGIDWGTGDVLAQTIAALEGFGMQPTLLGVLSDVDRPEDVPIWEAATAPPATLTVVIPALNEGDRIGATAASAASPGVEVIVVDGGSTDSTQDAAREAGARVVMAPRGRASQMNAGAKVATGDALLFLHADTLLPQGYRATVLETLADPDVAVGAFSFATDVDTPTMRLFARNTNWRARTFGSPYGDQALFCRAALFRSLGGFPEMPLLEDFEFVRRARSVARIAVTDASITTSGRAWQERGAWRWMLINRATAIAYHLGVSPAQLVAWRQRSSKR